MKLRTKLVLVSATVLFLASGLSGAAMMVDTLRFHEVQAAESGRAQLTAAANAIGSQMESSRILEYGEVTRTAYFHFLLDKYDASRFLLLENDIVLCNQTDYEFVEGGTEGWNGEEVQSLIQKTDGRHLLICGRRIPMETTDAYSLVMIQDISGIYQDALRRIPVLAAICLEASLAASAALSLLARRLLSPLEQLRCAAVRISEGDMSCRARISGHDEITALACAFNHMADRVEEQMELLNRAAEQR
ncbi:MAG TPA: HAMP domain-containing protein, partial [Candidatus Eisenbergiella intestinigallinarum]|nr:HAMP domain-containing protein [Candidatus Eisenbergiella intestinigallinarum]